ncbi:MAG: hypothetical protein QOF51_298 [Chloroflexota bacterium]|nr:hypothetical protein [Chloroflexota bacterium]
MTSQMRALAISYGAEGRDRTADTAIFSRMLYRLSYLGVGVSRAVVVSASLPAVGETGLEPVTFRV